ncbi:hypothetical protein ABW21_db0201441 [Orbilia brochopaga]|nr:hypothetical protein ABW21_db0201441 [Drechslerella brochopaga]
MTTHMVPFTPQGPPPSEVRPALVGSVDFIWWIRYVRSTTLHPRVQKPAEQAQPPGLSIEEIVEICNSTNDPHELARRLRGSLVEVRRGTFESVNAESHPSERTDEWLKVMFAERDPQKTAFEREHREREWREWPPKYPPTYDIYQLEELPRHIPVHIKFVEADMLDTKEVSDGDSGIEDTNLWISLELFPEAADQQYRDPGFPFEAYRRPTEFSVDTVEIRHYANAIYTRTENFPRTSVPRERGHLSADKRYIWYGYQMPVVCNDSPACEEEPQPHNSSSMVLVLAQHRYLKYPESPWHRDRYMNVDATLGAATSSYTQLKDEM